MATYVIGGYAASDFTILGGGQPAIGAQFRLDPDWSASTHALTITVTDDDSTFDASQNGASDPTQSAVITDAQGVVVADGPARLVHTGSTTDGAGQSIQVYEVYVNDVLAGYASAQPIQPGTTYEITTGGDVGLAPDYGSFATSTYEQSADNSASGGGFADDLRGGAGDDSLTGGSADDTLWGGEGNDTLRGGIGNDTLEGGDGNDSLYGDDGADRVAGGAGGDRVDGGSGNDTLLGEDGNDTLVAGLGNDSMRGGTGDDWLYTGAGSDTLWGEAGSDTFFITEASGPEVVHGGEDIGTVERDMLDFRNITTSDGVRVVFSGDESGGYTLKNSTGQFTGIEGVAGTERDDVLNAATSGLAQSLDGREGRDTLTGGSADDALSGGQDEDVLTGGGGDDLLTGGGGSDRLVLSEGGGRDTATDFNMTRDGSDRTTDQIDVSRLRAPDGSPVRIWDVTVSDDGDGNALLAFPNGEELILQGVTPTEASAKLNAMGVPCFVSGTLIDTPAGGRRVEDLRPGDLVSTRDHGPQPLVWTGGRALGPAQLRQSPQLRPVLIEPGRIGAQRRLLLSPQHAVMLRIAGQEVLVRARHLAQAGLAGIRLASAKRHIGYHHLLCARHEILLANGVACESLYPGPQALLSLGSAGAADLLARRSDLAGVLAGRVAAREVYGPPARPVLERRRLLALEQAVLEAARVGSGPLPNGNGAARGSARPPRLSHPSAEGQSLARST